MGAVYSALDTNLGRAVALKVIRPELVSQPQVAERFLREARAAAAIKAPEVVSILHLGTERGIVFMAMELVEGQSLDKVLQAGPLPPARVARIALSVARALRAAHRNRIIHRDVKPANILIADGEDGDVVKLADLGLAKSLDTPKSGEVAAPLTAVSVGMGTPGYMPPEQILDAASVDHRADIFSLGASVYQMLSGRTPFEGKTLREIMQKTIGTPPTPLPEHTKGALGQLVARMLEKDPKDRPQSCDEIIAELERGISGPAAEPAPTAPKKIYVPLIGGGAVLAAVVAVIASSAGRRSPTPAHPTAPSPVVVAQKIAPPSPAPIAQVPSGPAAPETLPAASSSIAPDVQAALSLAYSGERAGAAPSAAVAVLGRRAGAGAFRKLGDGEELSSEDDYRILVRPEGAAFVYVFQIDSRGKLDVLYPRLPGARFSTGANPVAPGDWTAVPAQDAALHLDERLGVEHVYVAATAQRWPELEQALRRGAEARARRPVAVEAPLGFRTRGVGGITRVPLPAAKVDVEEQRNRAEKVELMVTGAKGVLVVERWFKHVAPPRAAGPWQEPAQWK
jgi:serine/threonine protein kinase